MIGQLLYHYLILDFYDPVWPNIAASAVLTVIVVGKLRAMEKLRKLHHREAMQQAQEHHDSVIAHITSATGPRSAPDPPESTAASPDDLSRSG